jgi:Asp-tRNA(Asn)/Glu-tRNA(Gln) amidotransferase A subunit family amidase
MVDTQKGYLEATVTGIQDAIQRGEVTSATLVKWYLDRIEAIDRQGPKLQAIVNVNPQALQQAEALDRHFAATGTFKGPLHGVPVLVKDQGETSFVPTTFGSKGFENYQPTTDATLVTKLIDAGAIILAKSSMCDFAAGWFSFSSVTDRTRNPYGLDRDAGGSSAGTGAGIAEGFSSLAMIQARFPTISRSSIISSGRCTNDNAIQSTPMLSPKSRSSRSFVVKADIGKIAPGTFTPLRSEITPAFKA